MEFHDLRKTPETEEEGEIEEEFEEGEREMVGGDVMADNSKQDVMDTREREEEGEVESEIKSEEITKRKKKMKKDSRKGRGNKKSSSQGLTKSVAKQRNFKMCNCVCCVRAEYF